MCLALSVITVQCECLFLVTVCGDFQINRQYALITEKSYISRDHTLLASISQQTCPIHISETERDVKKKVMVKLACYKNFLHHFM